MFKCAKPINIYVLLIVVIVKVVFHLNAIDVGPISMVLRVIGFIVDEILRGIKLYGIFALAQSQTIPSEFFLTKKKTKMNWNFGFGW